MYSGCYHWMCPVCVTYYKAYETRKAKRQKFEYHAEKHSLDLPMGASQWLNHGRKYGYVDYFRKTLIKKKLLKNESTNSANQVPV